MRRPRQTSSTKPFAGVQGEGEAQTYRERARLTRWRNAASRVSRIRARLLFTINVGGIIQRTFIPGGATPMVSRVGVSPDRNCVGIDVTETAMLFEDEAGDVPRRK